MKYAKINLTLLLLVAATGAICLGSCGDTDPEAASSAQDDRQSQSSSAQGNPEYWLDMEAYQENLSGTRVSLAGYRGQYESDTASLTDAYYENLDFSDCTFRTLPEAEELSVLAISEPEVTAQEVWNLIEGWVSYTGKEDELDLKTDVKVISERLGTEENGDYFPDH